MRGGLGIKNLRKQNEAFMVKLCWKLVCDKEALWVKKVHNNKLTVFGDDLTFASTKKTKSFLWIFAHGRAHTASLRQRRGLEVTSNGPFDCEEIETNMHLIRDYANAIQCKQLVVDPTLWFQFTSLQGVDWIKWNLGKEAGKDFTKNLSWPTLFEYICWDTWVVRCNQLFNHSVTTKETSALPSFFKAYWDQDMVTNCSFYNIENRARQVYQNLQGEYAILEVDGSITQEGRRGCGGVIRSNKGAWIFGFSCKINSTP
ncbi:uncharacterized protein LOC114722886 [Neltuma alba]|uniref:uncharacterized protein LOC114722886 n=1 Tax=Neltuma alba TaxID=207710 RepID=UPI0010A554C4|nr:uncharacterized protein LOC114722886 [Prosopis alba]